LAIGGAHDPPLGAFCKRLKVATFVLTFIWLGFVYSIIAGIIISGYTNLFVSGYNHHLELLLAPIFGGISALIHAFVIANRRKKNDS
jgi:ammonia channel protein AmtB